MYSSSSNLSMCSSSMCRICLIKTKDHALNIFDDNEESKEIRSKIYTCFQIKLSPEKNLPNVMCENCIDELNIAYKFRLKCLTFEEKYGNYLKEIKEETEYCGNVNNLKEVDKSEDAPLDTTEDNYDIYDHDITSDDKIKIKSETDGHSRTFNVFSLSDTQNKFQCSICHKVLRSKVSLAKHNVCMHQKRKHAGRVTGSGASRRYHCTKCPYHTPHSQTLVNHMHRHDGVRPYQCECGKSFTQSSSLAAHRKTHSLTTFYTCSTCGKQFKHAFSLKKHLLVHEKGNFNCEICHKTLKTKKSLQDHMHRHYNIRNYNCEDCGDTFVTSSELQSHRLKHSLEKKVECHLCGYRTNTKKSLIVHLKRHAGNKSFKCGSCDLSFYTGGDLRRHRRVHSREKPYPCPACAARFTHSSSLNKHVLNLHHVQYRWADFHPRDSRKILAK
ncbi:zinc finger protein ZFP2-like [Cydia fagiglandana]|uniref:zinc finger protein ZFP2-like n=1 Tax=Cydia fagiglandana TaxID=1458189 RepID=UPI002FEDF790